MGRRRTAILGCLLLVLVAWLAAQRLKTRRRKPTRLEVLKTEAWKTLHAPGPTPAVTFAPDVAVVRQAFDDADRLEPDRRFLAALTRLSRIFASRDERFSASFSHGRWHIKSADTDLGEWPEFPDFQDAFDTCVRHATALQRKRAIGLKRGTVPETELRTLQRSLESTWLNSAIPPLLDADARWSRGAHDPDLLALIVRGLARAAFQQVDTAGLGDDLPAAALAALAAQKTLTGRADAENLALVAESMGYANAADRAIRALPARDPLRMYLGREDASLRSRALTGSEESRYLWLRRAVERDDMAEIALAVARVPKTSLPAALVLLSANGFESAQSGIAGTFALSAKEADDLAGAHDSAGDLNSALEAHRVLKFFDEVVDRLVTPDSAFAGATVARAWYRGAFYGAVCSGIRFEIRRRGDPEGALGWLTALQTGTGGTATAVRSWAESADATSKKIVLGGELSRRLQESPLGPELWAMDLDQSRAGELFTWKLARVHELARRMDSRPEDRSWMLYYEQEPARDLVASERLIDAVLGVAKRAYPEAVIARAEFDGNLVALKAFALDARENLDLRIDAAETATRIDPVRGLKVYRALMDSAPGNPEIAYKLIDRLRKLGLRTEAAKTARESLRRTRLDSRPANSLIEQKLAGQAAIALCDVGETRIGSHLVGPLDRTEVGDVLAAEAICAAKTGDATRALELARRDFARYGGKTYLHIVEVEWMLGRNDDAAQALANPPGILNWRDDVYQSFREAFPEGGDKAVSAFTAMSKVINAEYLLAIARSYAMDGAPDQAAKLSEPLAPRAPLERTERDLDTFRFLEKAHGRDVAAAWIRPRLEHTEIGPLQTAFMCVNFGVSEPAWLLPELKATDSRRESVWYFRVLSTLATHPPEFATHEAEIRAHYSGAGEDTDTWIEGRFLAGYGTLADLEGSSKVAKKDLPLCAAYRARREGRLADAITWWRLTRETLKPDSNDSRWSGDELAWTFAPRRSLARQVAELRAAGAAAATAGASSAHR